MYIQHQRGTEMLFLKTFFVVAVLGCHWCTEAQDKIYNNDWGYMQLKLQFQYALIFGCG